METLVAKLCIDNLHLPRLPLERGVNTAPWGFHGRLVRRQKAPAPAAIDVASRLATQSGIAAQVHCQIQW